MRVLITGASTGIGYEFARLYAEDKHNLVLVARDDKKLQEIKTDLSTKYSIQVDVIALDLSKENSASKLISTIGDSKIDIVINNAGVGELNDFIDSSLEKITHMLNLNITTLTQLTHHFAKLMSQNGGGKILNIASTAGFQPIPRFGAYAASKAYVLYLSEAINFELRDKNVFVGALCPGPTKTNFAKNANAQNIKHLTDGTSNAKEVAQEGIKQLQNNEMTVVVGLKNKLLAFSSSMSPFRKLTLFISNKIME